MINVEIIKVHAGQILPCGRVTGNKEFTIGGLTVLTCSVDTLSLMNLTKFWAGFNFTHDNIRFGYSLSVVIFHRMVNSCCANGINRCTNAWLFRFTSLKRKDNNRL